MCSSDLAMQEAMAELGSRFTHQHGIQFALRVGINTGEVLAGTVGDAYTVMGDAVNVASRLEGQTKYYGIPVIIGSRTAEKVSEKFAILELDLITVKGKTEPEAIYTVLGREEVAGDIRFQELRKVYSTMLYSYRSRDWEGALEALQVCRSFDRDFGLEALFDLYRARVQAFSEVAPPADWNGVFVAETK